MSLSLDPSHVWRDFATDGVPSSGSHNVRKPDVRRLLSEHQQALIALIADSGGLTLPNLLVRWSITGGDENDIIAEPNLDVLGPGLQIHMIEFATVNTGAMTLNGVPLLLNNGETVPGGYTAPDTAALFRGTGSDWRLLSYGNPDSLLAAVESVYSLAVAAKDAAEAAAASVGNSVAGFADVLDPDTQRVAYASADASLNDMSLADTLFTLTRGSPSSPDARNEPLFVLKKITSAATPARHNPTVAFLAEKRTDAADSRANAIYAQIVDYGGWDGTGTQSFVDNRLEAILATGADGGTAYGSILLAGAETGVDWVFLVGAEGDVINNTDDAPDTANFNKAKFAVSFMSTSSFGSKKVDAGFMTNPYTTANNVARAGFLVAEDSVDLVAFASRATTVFGLDLATGPGTQTYSAIRIPNAVPIHAKNAAGTGDVAILRVDSSNRLILGSGTDIIINMDGTERQLLIDGSGFLKVW